MVYLCRLIWHHLLSQSLPTRWPMDHSGSTEGDSPSREPQFLQHGRVLLSQSLCHCRRKTDVRSTQIENQRGSQTSKSARDSNHHWALQSRSRGQFSSSTWRRLVPNDHRIPCPGTHQTFTISRIWREDIWPWFASILKKNIFSNSYCTEYASNTLDLISSEA